MGAAIKKEDSEKRDNKKGRKACGKANPFPL